jgi:two-component system sensor histidine kinase ArlS
LKLKNKFTLLTSSLVICILLIVDLVVYLLFINIATRNEIELLRSKSEQIIEKIGPMAIMNKDQEKQIMDYLPEDSVIRLLNPRMEVVRIFKAEGGIDLGQIQVANGVNTKLLAINGQKLLVVRVPIQSDSKNIGTFEIIEKLETLNANMNLLVMILTFTTGGAVLLSIVGGLLLFRTVLKPISESIQTMGEIESSLAFKKIPTRGRSNDELFTMTETFNRMMERLKESFLKQQRFVSDASHELNTALTIIEGYANMLRRWGTIDEKVHRESIEAIYEESKHMRTMTQQLLDLASSQQNEKPNLERFELVACCEQVSAMISKLHSQKIIVHSEEKEAWIEADLAKIKQLLIILIDNALKYSKSSIELRVSLTTDHIEIRVKDYGIGIPRDEIGQVFERFYRVDQSRDRKTGGTGLGLPIAQSIVKEHHGTIRIESEEGHGTEVIVELPRAQRIDLG